MRGASTRSTCEHATYLSRAGLTPRETARQESLFGGAHSSFFSLFLSSPLHTPFVPCLSVCLFDRWSVCCSVGPLLSPAVPSPPLSPPYLRRNPAPVSSVSPVAAPLGPIRVMHRDMDSPSRPPFWSPLQDSPSEDLISALITLLPTTKLTERAEEETHDFLTSALQHVLQHPALHWWCNPQLRPISMEMLTLFGFEENESLKGYKSSLENVLGGCLDCTEAYQQDRRIFINRYEHSPQSAHFFEFFHLY